jgi:hypothetical protein
MNYCRRWSDSRLRYSNTKTKEARCLKKDVNISGMATKRLEQKIGKRQERKCRRFYEKAPTLRGKVDYSGS